MDQRAVQRKLEDFNQFCCSLDVRAALTPVDKEGNAASHEKEVYALAILRALLNGAFGEDRQVRQAAVCALWERGSRKGFNAESFNEVFEEFFIYW